MKPLKHGALIFAGVMAIIFFTDRLWRMQREHRQDKNIFAAARKHGVDPALIKAVIWRESRFNPRARGSKGEIGLMQIMPDTALDWAGAEQVANLSDFVLADPARNIDCGTWYLRKLLQRYTRTDDPVPYALTDYNAGRGNVLKWLKDGAATNSGEFIEQIGFPSTREYVRSVMKRREKYAAWASPPSN
ncbi:MAG TPA: lytic transglycosylase domain-containing protein [Candidatus Acidoferrum sp.]|nr:lytic transglycosylase domain-containing protein [Candidatus Acidoferrum sp.]